LERGGGGKEESSSQNPEPEWLFWTRKKGGVRVETPMTSEGAWITALFSSPPKKECLGGKSSLSKKGDKVA